MWLAERNPSHAFASGVRSEADTGFAAAGVCSRPLSAYLVMGGQKQTWELSMHLMMASTKVRLLVPFIDCPHRKC
jgi:hypothetical protein